MKNILLPLFVIFIMISPIAQTSAIDSICIQLNQQELAINELYSANKSFIPLNTTNNGNDTLIIVLEKFDTIYFRESNWLFEPDTIYTHDSKNSLIEKKDIVRGTNYVLANKIKIVNVKNQNLLVSLEDNKLVLIQEAKDSTGLWKPIEYFVHSDCGNSYSSFTIPPKMYCEFKIAKYCGVFKTSIRVRILINQNEYVSNEIEGFINRNQFKLPIEFQNNTSFREYLFHKNAY